jgi:peptidoglycan/xylan/chitin deacetylase (PgdA/CDA1 family)
MIPRRWGLARALFHLPETGVSEGDRLVALTFDDGPHPDHTPPILDVLARYDVPATFFVPGRRALEQQHLLRAVSDAGHTLGNHTWDHVLLEGLEPAELERQVAHTNQLVESVTGQVPRYVRPPRGRCDPQLRAFLQARGLAGVLWSVDPRDWEAPGVQAIVARTVETVTPGRILLLHDGGGPRGQTVAALPAIIEALTEVGYRFVALPQRPLRIERGHTSNIEHGRKGHVPRAIVVHTNVGTLGSTIHWFATAESGVSAHYLVGLNGRVVQFVDESDVAKHAGRVHQPSSLLVSEENPNLYTIGVEFEDGGDPESVDRPSLQYRAGSALIRAIAERWSIPLDREHVIGHREIYARKTCPGNLDVERLLREAAR